MFAFGLPQSSPSLCMGVGSIPITVPSPSPLFLLIPLRFVFPLIVGVGKRPESGSEDRLAEWVFFTEGDRFESRPMGREAESSGPREQVDMGHPSFPVSSGSIWHLQFGWFGAAVHREKILPHLLHFLVSISRGKAPLNRTRGKSGSAVLSIILLWIPKRQRIGFMAFSPAPARRFSAGLPA
jgi:hypothetical protein